MRLDLDLARHPAAALVPAQVLQADPAHLVPAAPVPLVLDHPPPPAPQVHRAPAADAMTTAAVHVHRKPEYETQCSVKTILSLGFSRCFMILQLENTEEGRRQGTKETKPHPQTN